MVALVSDAGTPLVSDPGFVLVQACVAAGLAVEVLPGPSAALAALVASALPADRWRFVGFLPRKKGELQAAFGAPETVVAFESPRRVAASLQVLAGLDPERPVAVCRELTKLHEEVVRGTAAELAARYADDPPRGEVALVVGGAPAVSGRDRPGARCAASAGRGRRQAAPGRFGRVRPDGRARQPALQGADGKRSTPTRVSTLVRGAPGATPGPLRTSPAGLTPRPLDRAATLLRLQNAAGNTAVKRLIARDRQVPANPTTLSDYTALRGELSFDTAHRQNGRGQGRCRGCSRRAAPVSRRGRDSTSRSTSRATSPDRDNGTCSRRDCPRSPRVNLASSDKDPVKKGPRASTSCRSTQFGGRDGRIASRRSRARGERGRRSSSSTWGRPRRPEPWDGLGSTARRS